ncbi:TPA: hypothetical protein ACSP36_004001, partial [Aeromonas hydrophila]
RWPMADGRGCRRYLPVYSSAHGSAHKKAHLLISYAIKQEFSITLSNHACHRRACKLRHVSKEGDGDGNGNQRHREFCRPN